VTRPPLPELPIPDTVETDPAAFEILRVWAAHGEQHVAIHSRLEGGPESFGFMLAQLAKHGAILYAEREGMSPKDALKLVQAGFDDECNQPTGWPTGGIPREG
jgi:hypothetical protein